MGSIHASRRLHLNVALSSCPSEVLVLRSDCAVGLLLSEIRKRSQKPDIVGLRTAEGLYRLDCWLADMKRPVSVLSKADLLVPVTRLNCPGKVRKAHFTKLRYLGSGGSGLVYLGEAYTVRKNDDGRLLAMKCLDKHQLLQTNKVQKAFDELNCHKTLSSPFHAKLHYAFQSVTPSTEHTPPHGHGFLRRRRLV